MERYGTCLHLKISHSKLCVAHRAMFGSAQQEDRFLGSAGRTSLVFQVRLHIRVLPPTPQDGKWLSLSDLMNRG